ncbi:uncharacterized protein BP01DRAFT_23509 [Aspergillus saccharolyticus JOP 1030-1]|uniref:Uncharacterized protein n=1 Tax=Aspergillus saccharolyticus JOP 1030-1 TaxID=1450539 RepID=A0A318ZGM0_9EURO|nr:hypothetical protein BP01DRAFT_23509 [Aspergillus saccharolyticus JOP 1030-1]PYH46135.1 hypothetical protein BP01DRAFT_23509 [Aspergillus saccharolyticus JOP 1030-1]
MYKYNWYFVSCQNPRGSPGITLGCETRCPGLCHRHLSHSTGCQPTQQSVNPNSPFIRVPSIRYSLFLPSLPSLHLGLYLHTLGSLSYPLNFNDQSWFQLILPPSPPSPPSPSWAQQPLSRAPWYGLSATTQSILGNNGCLRGPYSSLIPE